ncbi:trehalose 2-sulfotransferase [Aldersonia kunmingensis]|uniref:trehalose 2-sulfotransferase n=1 Tax=Aldersonia kunmingensis TaxID=408066 RepID=UPI00082C3DA1|nr:Stf0 family sulfotransferase [Aldersonia kunmingensis]
MTRPPSSYLVCASQRSGSTLLVESLRATGIAGEPEEYFQYIPETGRSPQPRDWFASVHDETILKLLAPRVSGTPDSRTSEQWRDDLLREGRTPNGVWGGKLMWNQTPLLLARAAALPNPSGTDLRSAIRDVVGEVTFIWVRRSDIVKQAVSMWRAVQTQVWRDDGNDGLDDSAQYHAGGIAYLAEMLRGQDDSWEAWFSSEGIEPIEVSFEELTASPQITTASILERLGLDPSLSPPPPLKRQSNSRSAEWVRQFHADVVEGLHV